MSLPARAILRDAGIPCAPINSFADGTSHPHTEASFMITELTHPRYGSIKTVRQPIAFDGKRNALGLPPPVFGEHTLPILRELGYSPHEIAQLERDKTVRTGP